MVLVSSKRLSLNQQLVLVVAAMLCWHVGDAAASHTPPQPESEDCMESKWSCPACFLADSPAEHLNYGLKVSDDELGHVIVKVYPKSCPSLNVPDIHSLPDWFRLEAFSEATLAAAGEFEKPHSRLEAYLCSNTTSVIFKTCERDPMDFPKTFTWRAPADNLTETVCFRLTIHSDRHWCQQITSCIAAEMSGSASGSGSGELEPEEETTGQAFAIPSSSSSTCSQSREERCYRNWNCTGKDVKRVLFCGSNGMMFHSRCERRLWECLNNRRISISRNLTACSPAPCNPFADWPSTQNCKKVQEFECGRSWEPRCSCRSRFYKLVQCDKDSGKCWCVYDNSPDEILNTRASLDNCVDPESYDFAASCLSIAR